MATYNVPYGKVSGL